MKSHKRARCDLGKKGQELPKFTHVAVFVPAELTVADLSKMAFSVDCRVKVQVSPCRMDMVMHKIKKPDVMSRWNEHRAACSKWDERDVYRHKVCILTGMRCDKRRPHLCRTFHGKG